MRGTSVFVAALVLLTTGAHAQVRLEPQISPFIDQRTDPAAGLLFGRGGYFTIAGGVVLAGAAVLYLEANGADRPIPADQVQPLVDPDGGMSLRYEGADYRVGIPAGLACPLGRFVARDGFIAYTVPKYLDPDSRRLMMRAGLRHHRVAREFDGTRFEALLRAADFASTTPLPKALEQHLITSLNDADGMQGFVIDAADAEDQPIGSLINTDIQVTYHVYLMPATRQVEIGGVPLRYFWELDPNGGAGVFAVDAFAQDWPAGTTLSSPAKAAVRPTQYDILNFYQVAALFRQLHRTLPARFDRFVDQACDTTSGGAQAGEP